MKIAPKTFPAFVLLAALLALAPDSQAQLKKLYDPQKVVTIRGQIEKLQTITRQGRQAKNGRQTQIAHLKTDQGIMVVHLGPAEFLARQQFWPRVGESLEVTGGQVRSRAGEVILATTVTAGGRTFTLRDNQGNPVWTGQTPGCYGPVPGQKPSPS